MFRRATCVFEGRSVLLVEDDQQTASVIMSSVYQGGGKIVGFVPTVEAAVGLVSTLTADLLLLHVRYASGFRYPIEDLFAPRRIAVEYLVCFDDWFDFPDDCEDRNRAVACDD